MTVVRAEVWKGAKLVTYCRVHKDPDGALSSRRTLPCPTAIMRYETVMRLKVTCQAGEWWPRRCNI